MSSADAVAIVLWIGATMYAVFGGADFGAGLWSLLAGGGDRGRRPRELIDWAIGPVWEANHVWLIFVLVVLWTGFSSAFEAIFSTLFIPLSLAALGIVLRGSGFAFHKTARRARGRAVSEGLFGSASLLTPFFMGTVVGAIAGGRVPVGNAAGDAVTSWLNPLSLVIGALFVATSAYLSAVFLVSDARRAGAPDLERYFVTRALIAAVVTGALAAAGLVLLHSDAKYVFDGLTGDGAAARDPLAGVRHRRAGAAPARRSARRAPARGRRGRRRDLGLGRRAAPLPAPAEAHDRRRGGAERDAHRRADRLRRRRRARAAVDRAAVHARPARPRRRELATLTRWDVHMSAWPLRSVLAGAAGTVTMTAAYAAERRLRGSRHQGPLDYDDSLVPGQIVAMVMHLPHVTDKEDQELGFLLRWSYGSAFGLLHGKLRRTIGEPWASAVFGGTLMTATMTLFPLLGRTPPPWRWPPDMLATSLGTHAAYVAAVAAVDDAVRRAGVS